MQVIRDMRAKFAISWELLAFLWHAKMWWAIPMVTVLLLFGILIAFGSATGIGPFVYTMF